MKVSGHLAGLVSFRMADHIAAGHNALAHLVPLLKEQGEFRSAAVVAQPSLKAMGVTDQIVGELKRAGISGRCVTTVKPEPTIGNIREALADLMSEPVDVLIGIGGGSVLDAAKLFSVLMTNEADIADLLGTDRVAKPGIPTVLIPTTSGTGSEVTPNAIVTVPEEQLKVAVVSRHLLPRLVILDPVLTVSLPQHITAATGMDAFTHALESYISNKANPISDMYALESIRLISGSLTEAYRTGTNLEARESMLLGSMFGGMALTAAGTAAVHALAYPLGGQFGITHGVANAMLLPHVMAWNLDAVADRLAVVAEAMGLPAGTGRPGAGGEAVIERIFEWTQELSIPQSLRSYGVGEHDVDDLAHAAAKVTRLLNNNPKKIELEDMKAVYRKLLP